MSEDPLGIKIGQVVAQCFDLAEFYQLFKDKPFTDGWTLAEALGVWYALGYLCLLTCVSHSSFAGQDISVMLDQGLQGLLSTWQMEGRTKTRFEAFNRSKLSDALNLYTSASPSENRRFFALFVAEIVGKDSVFLVQDSKYDVLTHLLAGNQLDDVDMILQLSLAQKITIIQTSVRNAAGTRPK